MEFCRVFRSMNISGHELVCESKIAENEATAELCICNGERVYMCTLSAAHKSSAKKVDEYQFIQLCVESLRNFNENKWDYKLDLNSDHLTLTIKQFMVRNLYS